MGRWGDGEMGGQGEKYFFFLTLSPFTAGATTGRHVLGGSFPPKAALGTPATHCLP
ncbi:hypothetical protein PI95_034790, partial [Hassallia byssoidea VB512170]|nr:hypothetical protein [Hassalia byssoidea VB512170]